MAEKNSAGQASKAAAERRTEQAAADTEAQQADSAIVDATPARDDDAPATAEGVDPALRPYPDYEGLSLDDLRSHAESRGVEINRDVEKAHLIASLRAQDTSGDRPDSATPDTDAGGNRYASYDVMPLERLRELAKSRDTGLDPDVERAHLVTELRAADSGVSTGRGTTI